MLKNPKDLKKSIESLLLERNELKKEIETLHLGQASLVKDGLFKQIENIHGINLLFAQIDIPNADALKKISFELKNEIENLVAVLATEIDGKPQIAVIIDEELVKSKGWNAGTAVRELAKEIQGGGGGQAFFATAGGKDVSGLPKVLEKARLMFIGL
jgi:alanyl-tRNA synthetase